MPFGGISVWRSSGGSGADRLVFRFFLQDFANPPVVVSSGTANLRLYEQQADGTLKSYDWSDNTFKTTALTTENQAMTHRQGNNATRNTGIWTHVLTTLTGFTQTGLYYAEVEHATTGIVPLEFEYGALAGY